MIPTEIKLQETVEDWLSKKGLFTQGILYSREGGGFLRINFILKPEISEFLDLIEYRNLADRTGVIMGTDGYSILLRGMALGFFFSQITNG